MNLNFYDLCEQPSHIFFLFPRCLTKPLAASAPTCKALFIFPALALLPSTTPGVQMLFAIPGSPQVTEQQRPSLMDFADTKSSPQPKGDGPRPENG